jgi:alpha-D-ribose 1-methylphosphonate 5-triphosphate synthase subunit PhnH
MIMNTMSRPGLIHDFQVQNEAPIPLSVTAAAVALTLCDFQTPVWLAPEFRTKDIERFLRFHTGASLTETPREASFALIGSQGNLAALTALASGTHEYPDRSATAVIQVSALSNEGPVSLSGPGIKERRPLSAEGLGTDFWSFMQENHARFPIGIDVVFVSPTQIAACPRSTAIALLEMV